jgi:hypothetical protein
MAAQRGGVAQHLPALGARKRLAVLLAPVRAQQVVLVKLSRALRARVLSDLVEALHMLFQIL